MGIDQQLFSYAKDFDILNDGSFVSCGLGNGLDGGMYRSTDAGATWELMNNGINNTVTYALEATPDGRILNGVIGHVDVSNDNGLTFDRVELPIGNIIRDINSNASGAIVACSGDGIATSQDGGATWTQTHAGDFYCFTTNADGSFLASVLSDYHRKFLNQPTTDKPGRFMAMSAAVPERCLKLPPEQHLPAIITPASFDPQTMVQPGRKPTM